MDQWTDCDISLQWNTIHPLKKKKEQGFDTQHKWLNLVNLCQIKLYTEHLLHLNEQLRVEKPIATEEWQP
jgi:hypothetical protein